MTYERAWFFLRIGLLIWAAAGLGCTGGDVPSAPAASSEGIERPASQLERGRYLVEGILWCFQCHSELDTSQPGHPPQPGRAGVGRILSERDGNRLVAPNLTSDPVTGIGRLSDAELARAIRQGIGRDGRRLRAMRTASFSVLSDTDLAAVIAYLRSLAPVFNELPATQPPGEPDPQATRQPLIAVDEPDLSEPLARGRYLVELADCVGCHTAWAAPRMPGALAGGNQMHRAPGTFSSNITADATGIGYGPDAFVEVMRNGKGGTLHPEMPWAAFRHVTADDLRAIYRALETVAPVRHLVNNVAEPSLCTVCGQEHGGGGQNELVLPDAKINPGADVLDAYVGEYHNAQLDMTIVIERDGEQLSGQAGPWAFPLVPQTERLFFAPGFVAPIRFESEGDMAADRLVVIEVVEHVFDRSR